MDIALDLFTEHGYDKTSLREIADELGYTKAALYYHFERKEDILLALHLRLHALGHGIFDRLSHLEDHQGNVGAWSELLDQFIDQILANRKLFLFHIRNQNALEQMARSEHNAADHEDMEQELRHFLSDPGLPVAIRVRMACAIGAVMGALMGSGEAFADVPTDDLARFLRDAIGDLLGPTRAPGSARRSPRASRW